jgi:OFA family oxalate/formate antiporter-like MFS transporter
MRKYAILASGTLLQLCLGTIYAFSYFQNPLMVTYGWTNSQVSMIFSLAILFLGLSAAAGGIAIKRFGPRRLASAGAFLYGAAYLGSALALRAGCLWALYLAFGVAGGMGLGLGYVTPVATVTKWFAGKKGFATGAVVWVSGSGPS